MHRSDGVMKPCVRSSRENQAEQAGLPDSPQPLEVRMLDNIEQDFVRNPDEAVYRVVDDFEFVQRGKILVVLIH